MRRTVPSPVTGMVANKTVTLGQMVSAGTQLMTVEQIDAVYVVVQVEQKDIDKVDIGTPATVKVDAYPDKVFAGEIAVMNLTWKSIPWPPPRRYGTRSMPSRASYRQA
ncbi:MAG: efflux RND transporter periplasmic adaptor subunit [Selenomonadaceae bacterium]|nr:efflux RND transporter periplasmic adaptor subunit [Selenomonadaceae bacterium]